MIIDLTPGLRPVRVASSTERRDGDTPGPLYLRESSEGWTAITPTVVLAGWRDTAQALDLLDLLDLPRLRGLRLRTETARARPGIPPALGTLSVLVALTGLATDEREALADDIGVALSRPDPAVGTDAAGALAAVRRLHRAHPRDPAVLAALLLRRLELAPAASIELGPGTPRLLLSGRVRTQCGREAVVAALDPGGSWACARHSPTAFAGLLAADSDIRMNRV